MSSNAAYAELGPPVPVSTRDVEALGRLVTISEDQLANNVRYIRGESVEETLSAAALLAQKVQEEVGEPTGETLRLGFVTALGPERVVLDTARNIIKPNRRIY